MKLAFSQKVQAQQLVLVRGLPVHKRNLYKDCIPLSPGLLSFRKLIDLLQISCKAVIIQSIA
jgi:hypothetical protein